MLSAHFPDQGSQVAQEWVSPLHCIYSFLPWIACFEGYAKATKSDLQGGEFPEHGHHEHPTMTETLICIESNPKASYGRRSGALSMEGVGFGELWQDQDA